MKKIHAEEGLKINPIYLLNTIGEINETNWGEIVERLFTPGLFIPKLNDGSLDWDFSTELVGLSSEEQADYKGIKVNISKIGRPARAYTRDGKLISLYSANTIIPYSFIQKNGNYGLYIQPNSVTIEQASYLPNYTVGTEKKDLMTEYLAGFQIIKIGDPVPDNCVQIATFTMTIVNNSGILSNLSDTRELNRAYLNKELYDFFPSEFLKHDYVVTAEASGVGKHEGLISYDNNENLKGTLTLYSAKSANSRINVIFDGTPGFPIVTFPNATETYILYIEVTMQDFFSGNAIDKPLLFANASSFNPSTDKIVVGVRTVNSVPTGSIIIEENEQ